MAQVLLARLGMETTNEKKYKVIDRFGYPREVASYNSLGHAIEAAKNISNTCDHATEVISDGRRIRGFSGRE